MGLFSRFTNKAGKPTAKQVQQLKLLNSDNLNTFTSWNGDMYNNDLIRSIIRVKARSISKAVAKHVREDANGLKVNPEPYIRILLEEPNPTMTMQQMLEKVVTQLELNNNAFILIVRDDNGYPVGLYPIVSSSATVYQTPTNEYLLQFTLNNGNTVTFKYSDLIHLRQDFNDNDLFGTPNTSALRQLFNIQSTLDQGIIKAIKNSNVIQWLLKYQNNLSPDDLKESTKRFVDSFLDVDSDIAGAVSVDNKMDAKQVKPTSIMPQTEMQKEITRRIYSYYNINEKIITSSYNEDEWIAFFESCIEPVLRQLSDTFTKALFTRKERSYGNKILFEGSDLAFASLKTKLALVQMVDRMAMTPNEWRRILNLAPQEGLDNFLLRKDTGQSIEEVTKED